MRALALVSARAGLWPGGDAALAPLGLLLLALAVPACYEIPPVVPADYVGSEPPPGWPPPRAYHPDPFHPANRWFHRAFSPRDPSGRLGTALPYDPLPEGERGRVDVAELSVLLDDVAAAGGWGSLGMFRPDRCPAPLLGADLLQVALHLAAGADGGTLRAEVVGETLALARGVGAAGLGSQRVGSQRLGPQGIGAEGLGCGGGLSEESLPAAAEPPPLRAGVWVEAPAPDSSDLIPSARDCRWTRMLYQETPGNAGGPRVSAGSPSGGSPSRWVLLRLRVAVDEEGSALLLPFGSECLELRLERGPEDGPPVRLWLFDRSRWVAGLEPWVLVLQEESGPAERLAQRRRLTEAGRLAHASAREAARAVPGAAVEGEPEADSIPYRPVLPKPWRDRQRGAVEEVLRGTLGSEAKRRLEG